MLKVSPGEGGSFFNADKRKKQVTLVDPTAGQSSLAEDRRPTVAAPKMFAFDAIFTEEDSQVRATTHCRLPFAGSQMTLMIRNHEFLP